MWEIIIQYYGHPALGTFEVHLQVAARDYDAAQSWGYTMSNEFDSRFGVRCDDVLVTFIGEVL